MDNGSLIVNVIASISTICTVILSYNMYRVANEAIKVSLFEKRLAIIMEIWKILSGVIITAKVDQPEIIRNFSNIRGMGYEVLFEDEVIKYIEELRSDLLDYDMVERDHTVPGNTTKSMNLFNKFNKQNSELLVDSGPFKKYLKV